MTLLTPRWYPLRFHPGQSGFFRSRHRFNVNPSGRRSGKTEILKRKLVRCAMRGTRFDRPQFAAAAPTRDQAKRIYWADLKALTPKWAMKGDPSEGELVIRFKIGSDLHVLGMDKPERVEGQPWDGIGLDEYGNMKEGAWGANVRPALSDRLGWADFIGVPEGMNHYSELAAQAELDLQQLGHWPSWEILPPEEVEAARRDLHTLVFEQEYGGKFVDMNGVAILPGDKLLIEGDGLKTGKGAPTPRVADAVYAVIDTAMKDGTDNDGTGVVFFADVRTTGLPYGLVVLDWDVVQMKAALLTDWLPSVFQRLEEFARRLSARRGSLGAFIEDRQSGTILIQACAAKRWPGRALPEEWTELGKDQRALKVSGHHYNGKIKITEEALRKTTVFKGKIDRKSVV